VAPVWIGKVASPLRSFLKQQQPGVYGFISICGVAQPDQDLNVSRELAALCRHAPAVLTELKIGSLLPPDQQENGEMIMKYRFKREDLERFAPAIESFLAKLQE